MVGPNTLRSLDKLLELASAERRKLRLRRAAHIYAAVCSLAAHPGTSVAAADAGSADANQQAAADAVCRAVAALDSLGGSNPSHRAAADGAAADFEAAASSFRRQQQSASAAGGPLVPLALPLRGNVATDGDAPGRAVVELEALIVSTATASPPLPRMSFIWGRTVPNALCAGLPVHSSPIP